MIILKLILISPWVSASIVRITEDTPAVAGFLMHNSGLCAISYRPSLPNITAHKDLPMPQIEFVRLTRFCRTADEWKLSETGVITNLKYDSQMHTLAAAVNSARVGALIILRKKVDDYDGLTSTFFIAKDYQLVHEQSWLCVGVADDDVASPAKAIEKRLLVLHSRCRGSRHHQFKFVPINEYEQFSRKLRESELEDKQTSKKSAKVEGSFHFAADSSLPAASNMITGIAKNEQDINSLHTQTVEMGQAESTEERKQRLSGKINRISATKADLKDELTDTPVDLTVLSGSLLGSESFPKVVAAARETRTERKSTSNNHASHSYAPEGSTSSNEGFAATGEVPRIQRDEENLIKETSLKMAADASVTSEASCQSCTDHRSSPGEISTKDNVDNQVESPNKMEDVLGRRSTLRKAKTKEDTSIRDEL